MNVCFYRWQLVCWPWTKQHTSNLHYLTHQLQSHLPDDLSSRLIFLLSLFQTCAFNNAKSKFLCPLRHYSDGLLVQIRINNVLRVVCCHVALTRSCFLAMWHRRRSVVTTSSWLWAVVSEILMRPINIAGVNTSCIVALSGHVSSVLSEVCIGIMILDAIVLEWLPPPTHELDQSVHVCRHDFHGEYILDRCSVILASLLFWFHS